jgi:hypothetical protein
MFHEKLQEFTFRCNINKFKISVFQTLNITTGISDYHNMISTVIYNIAPANEKQKIKYRSVDSFIRLQRSNSTNKTKRVFPLFSHKRS